jgi:hypothetical protein
VFDRGHAHQGQGQGVPDAGEQAQPQQGAKKEAEDSNKGTAGGGESGGIVEEEGGASGAPGPLPPPPYVSDAVIHSRDHAVPHDERLG